MLKVDLLHKLVSGRSDRLVDRQAPTVRNLTVRQISGTFLTLTASFLEAIYMGFLDEFCRRFSRANILTFNRVFQQVF